MTRFLRAPFPRSGAVLLLAAEILFASSAFSQTYSYSVLHSFVGPGVNPLASLILASDGFFYGTTAFGGDGSVGTIFRIAPDGTGYSIVYSFKGGSDGATPYAGLFQGGDGHLYGTTYRGGADNAGTIFSVDVSMTPATSVWVYPFSGSDGANPRATLVSGGAGVLCGTTENGGSNGLGTVFQIATDGSGFQSLVSFSGGDGQNPQAGVIRGTDGNLYGTTAFGGTYGLGTIFRVKSGPALEPLHSFAGGDGSTPQAGLIEVGSGAFYGTTAYGGAAGNNGTVFRYMPDAPHPPPGGPPAGSNLTTLASFKSNSDGFYPIAGLFYASDGNFYGTTFQSRGTGHHGTVFRVTLSGTLTTLHEFTGSDGELPSAGLVQGSGSDTKLYGTTQSGGTGYLTQGGGGGAEGTVFGITLTGTLTTLHNFGKSEDDSGSFPVVELVEGSAGTLYGTTVGGGTHALGTIFKITTAAVLTPLSSFSRVDGAEPYGRLVLGTDGLIYGTTLVGGDENLGTVFKADSSGAPTRVYSFASGDGHYPRAGVVQGTDGLFYGTAPVGGASDLGTVFKVDPSTSSLTTLYSFDGSDGSQPDAGLVQGQGADTNFYGAAGTKLFKITPGGSLTPIHDFFSTSSSSGLVRGSDGMFYGTTAEGGSGGRGTIFRISSDGTIFETLHSFPFSGLEGERPMGRLVQGNDGSFYGTTYSGGASGLGTIFRIAPDGTGFQAFHSFSGDDGASPHNGLVLGSDGSFYGTTPSGGLHGGGVVFKVTPPSLVTATVSGGGTICGTGSVQIQAALTGTPPWSLTWSDGVTQSGIATSPVVRTVSPVSTTLYTLTAFSDASGPGTALGSAPVMVNPIPAMPNITAPAIVGEDSPNRAANVPNHAGSTYAWTITDGTITAGQGMSQITFRAGLQGTLTLSVIETSAAGCISAAGNATVDVAPAGGALLFYSLYPCRVFDTRNGSPLAPGEIRTIVPGGSCGIPGTAKVLAANATALVPGAAGHLQFWAAGTAQPPTSTLNFSAGKTRANNALISMPSGASVGFSVANISLGTTGLIVDVSGYFE